MVNNIYKPMVDSLGAEDWDQCEGEQKKEFASNFDKFAKELYEAMNSQQSKITLEPLPEEFRETAKNFNSNAKSDAKTTDMILAFERLFNKWQEKIEAALAEADAEKNNQRDAGPMMELEYWKKRMRKLTGIAEQLRSRNCRTVVDVLDQAGKPNSEHSGGQKDKIYLATSNWNGMENRVTEALNEAKDNVKYLQTLEKFLEPLYTSNPTTIKETLPALMNSIKMIHTIARYYNTNERMTGLFVKITNQMILNCKFNIINFQAIAKGQPTKGSMGSFNNPGKKQNLMVDDSCLWTYPADELIEELKSCIALKEAYRHEYEKTKKRVATMSNGQKVFDFSESEIFGKFELFCRRIGKLIDLFSTIRQFKELEKHNLENIAPIVQEFTDRMTGFKQKINKPLLDFKDDTFDRDFVEFNVEVSNVESDL
jgi:dynein heavy chain